MAKIKIPSKKVGYNASRSPMMKDFMSNPKIAKVLNRSFKKRKQLFEEVANYREGGVTVPEIKTAFGKLKYGTKDALTSNDMRIIAGQVIKSGPKYIRPDQDKGKENKILTRKEELKKSAETEKKSEPKKDIPNQYQLDEKNTNPNPNTASNLNQQVYGRNNPAAGKRNIYQVLLERKSRANLH